MAEISTIARPYAVAAYNLAKENNALASWSEMLGLASAVATNEDMQAYINDPKVLNTDLEETFLKVCGDRLNDHCKSLIKMLIEYKRMSIIPAITSAFEALKSADEGVIEAQIISATELSNAETAKLVNKLESKFGKKITATLAVDPEIIGGIKIIVGDTVIDASIKSQLQNLAYTLSA
jgi:F-type H+-transporting ATPase subunit delta